MFALAFDSIFSFIVVAMVIYGVYRFLFRDIILKDDELKKNKEYAIKLSIVKLHSNDSEDVEKFLNQNAQYLPTATVEKLATHLQNIKIFYDDPFKKRFEDLEQQQRVADDNDIKENSTEFSGIINRQI